MDATEKNKADEPWSFVVALASFIGQAILGGYVYTNGIFYTIFKREFPDASEVAVSWLCSLPITLWFIMGPLGSMVTNRFGCRLCTVAGGLLCSSSISLCFFSTNFYSLFLFYGLFAGVGNGILYVGLVTAVNRYFRKYRLAANIITPIGLTSGMAVYAAIVPQLSDVYGWRGALLILGGISFNICALGCLLFPTGEKQQQNSNRKILNLSILKDHLFQVFVIQCIFCNLSSSLVFLHLPALIISFGLGTSTGSMALTLYGIANCSGKIFHSIIGCIRKPDPTILYTCSLTICGTAMILIPTIRNELWIIILVCIVAFTYCVTGGHNVEVILYLVGEENISDGLGFGQVGKAMGSLLAGPVAGLLYSGTKLYSASFYVGGSMMIFGCLLMIPIVKKIISDWRKPERDVEVVYIASKDGEKNITLEPNHSNSATQPMLTVT
ncbi:hypothetical protein ACF0H5_016614 [Mactra antiquata]